MSQEAVANIKKGQELCPFQYLCFYLETFDVWRVK